MKYKNEVSVMKALGIESWRNLSKEKVIQFAAMLPEMDKEVALKIVGLFPEFRALASEVLNLLEKEHDNTIKSNNSSQDNVHRAYQEIRAILKDELNQKDISPETRMFILEQIIETGSKESEKDTENKAFLANIFNRSTYATVGVLVLTIIFVGGKFIVQKGKDLI